MLAATTWLLLSAIGATAHAETLTPEQAVDRAAKNNSSLRAAMHDVAAAGHAVDAADAARVPTLFAGAEGQIAERFSGSRDGVSRNVDRSIAGNTGVRYSGPRSRWAFSRT
jgi:outer membrane protein TolC